MYPKYQAVVLQKKESHVFRMIGAFVDVISTCKATMAAAGFTEFKSSGYSFVCSRQLEASNTRLMVKVQCTVLTNELCEISFEKFETGVSAVHSQMIHKRLNKIQNALEMKVA